MESRNEVFIARSLDGYIADKYGGLDWLNSVPNPDHLDLGYENFIQSVDAIVMGRATFALVCSFDMEWPYKLPVFVLSKSLKSVSEDMENKVTLVSGPLSEILNLIHKKDTPSSILSACSWPQGSPWLLLPASHP